MRYINELSLNSIALTCQYPGGPPAQSPFPRKRHFGRGDSRPKFTLFTNPQIGCPTVFGSVKRLYGRARVRYREFRRNLADFYRLATVYNLRRALTLTAA